MGSHNVDPREHKHINLLSTLGQALHSREACTWFCKVKSHTGIMGNKRADRGANLAAAADSKEGLINAKYEPRSHVRSWNCVSETQGITEIRRVFCPG